MAASVASVTKPPERASGQDVGFAVGIVFIVTVLFLPLPAFLIDLGLAFSIALSVLILMVALWIQKPLDFSAFPDGPARSPRILRLSLNIATTRLILSNGAEGYAAAGYVIAGFAGFVMSGDFVIGLVVFVDPDHRQLSSSSPRAPPASPKSAPASPSTPSPASRWPSTPISTPGSIDDKEAPAAGASSRKKAPSSAPWTAPPSSCAATRSPA